MAQRPAGAFTWRMAVTGEPRTSNVAIRGSAALPLSRRPQVINLHSVVLDVVHEIGPSLQGHVVNVSGAITYAFGDLHAVARILTCLLTNAARYSPAGSRIEIETSTDDDGSARMTIAEAGPGSGGAQFEFVLPSIAS